MLFRLFPWWREFWWFNLIQIAMAWLISHLCVIISLLPDSFQNRSLNKHSWKVYGQFHNVYKLKRMTFIERSINTGLLRNSRQMIWVAHIPHVWKSHWDLISIWIEVDTWSTDQYSKINPILKFWLRSV